VVALREHIWVGEAKRKGHCRSQLLPAMSCSRACAPTITCRKHTKLSRRPRATATDSVESTFEGRNLEDALLSLFTRYTLATPPRRMFPLLVNLQANGPDILLSISLCVRLRTCTNSLHLTRFNLMHRKVQRSKMSCFLIMVGRQLRARHDDGHALSLHT
jgi:hypothetical protein